LRSQSSSACCVGAPVVYRCLVRTYTAMPSEATVNHIFKHPWSDISYAVWRKYPNPLRPDVLSVDFLDRQLDPETGVLRTRRLVTVKGFFAFLDSVVFGEAVPLLLY